MTKKEKFNNFIENAALKTGDVNIESMLKNHKENFVIASGIQYSVRDFINQAGKVLNIKIKWEGTGLDEVGYWKNQEIIKVDPRYFRATEVETLLGDASKARKSLGWEPKITFEKLVEEMTLSDLKIAEKNELINKHGYQVKNYFE